MKRIEDVQEEIVRDFALLEDGFERYAYLIELSCALPPLPEEKRTEENLVKGCQSHVWLDVQNKNGLFYFEGDSDTLILKGILFLLREVLHGQPAREAGMAVIDFPVRAGLMALFEADRQKGIGYVIRTLQKKALGR